MAATDLVYNTIDPVLYTPDYAFLKYALDKKQARYDQGLDAVSSAYNNLKKNLTDPVLKERRDQFLKDAQGQLQKIASSDLSLGENINAANNVFDPLATNPAFIYDAYQTDRVNKGIQEMDDWAKSADMEVRKQYNPEIKAWLNRDLDSIRNGNGDIKNYHVQNRETFAAVDAQDILAKAAKDYGYTFKMDVPGHPYIVSVTGGTTGIPVLQESGDMDGGAVTRIFGFPVIPNPYMDVAGANNYPIYLACWDCFVSIADNELLKLQMFEQTSVGFVTMFAEKRVCSTIRDVFAGVRLKNLAS